MRELQLKNYNMASARLIGAGIFSPALCYFGYFILDSNIGVAVLSILGGIAYLWMAMTVITSLRLGEDIKIQYVFRSKTLPLGELEHVQFESTAASMKGIPVWKYLVANFKLRSGSYLMIKIKKKEIEELTDFLEDKGIETLCED